MPRRKPEDHVIDIFYPASVARQTRFYPASLEQQTSITRAIAMGNDYNDQMISSAITWSYTLAITFLGFKIFGAMMYGYEPLREWIYEEARLAVKPYLANFLRNYSLYFPSEEIFWQKFKEFHDMAQNMEGLLGTGNTEQLKANFRKDLIKLVGTSNQFILDRFNNLSIYALKTGHFHFEWNLAAILSLSSPVINTFIFDPIVKRILHKIYALRFIGERPRNALTDIAADKFLANLQKENLYKKALAQYAVITNRGILGLALTYSLLCYIDSLEWPTPEIMIFIFSIFVTVLQDIYKAQLKVYQRTQLANKLEQIDCAAYEIFTPFGDYRIVKKRTLTDCYIFFKAQSFNALSVVMVNQIVKDILLKNGIEVLEYSSSCFTCKLIMLSGKEIENIKYKIMGNINRWLHIKLFNEQLRNFFCEEYYVQKIFIYDDLPTVTTVIEFPLCEVGFQLLVNNFKCCRISRLGTSIVIDGQTPSKNYIEFGLARRQELLGNLGAYTEISPNYLKLRKVTPKKNFFQIPSITLVPNPTEEIKIYRWRSGVFNSASTTNSIKPFNCKFGNLYLLFSLPQNFFPSAATFNKVKAKIEEGRLATSEKGSQGLQFRPEVARDLTKPEQPWFSSFLRYKLLGKLGDARFYAKLELSTEGERLGVFCGGNWSAH